MVFALLRGVANVAMFFAILGGLIWAAFFGRLEHLRVSEDPGFAQEFFQGYLPFDSVLESRKWHPTNSFTWDCTYAIVELSEFAPDDPPFWRDREEGWQYRFGGSWQATPIAPLGSSTRDAIGFCAQYWPLELNERLKRATSEPGGWAIRGPVGETVYIYSVPERIAARIRFGD